MTKIWFDFNDTFENYLKNNWPFVLNPFVLTSFKFLNVEKNAVEIILHTQISSTYACCAELSERVAIY